VHRRRHGRLRDQADPRRCIGAGPAAVPGARRIDVTSMSSARSTPTQPRSAAGDVVAEVRDLAWSGRHVEVVALCEQALANPTLPPASRLALLDRCARSLLSLGQFVQAAAAAASMREFAAAQLDDPAMVRALCCQALVMIRSGEYGEMQQVAASALALAEQLRDPALLGLSRLTLGEVRLRLSDMRQALQHGRGAVASFERAGDVVGLGRAHWLIA